MHKLILILLTAVAVLAAEKQPRNDYWKESDLEILFDGNTYALRTPENTVSRLYTSATLAGIKVERAVFVKARNEQLDGENEAAGFWKDPSGKWWKIVERKPDSDTATVSFSGFTGTIFVDDDGVFRNTASGGAVVNCPKKSCKTCNP